MEKSKMKSHAEIKVCHCSVLHQLDDSRILHKECVTLARAGYSVTYVGRKPLNDEALITNYMGVKLHRLESANRLKNHALIFNYIMKNHVNIVHFHDPELIFVGTLLAIFRKKVIYDVHEDYHTTILNKSWLGPMFLRRFLCGLFKKFESLAICFMKVVVTATPRISLNYKCKRLSLIRNFPVKINMITDLNVKINKRKVVIYVGGLNKQRGIFELISAADLFRNDAELWLLGSWESDGFKLACESNSGYSNVRFFGKVSHLVVKDFLLKSDIGVCTLHPTTAYIDSYPIKIFEYFQCGLPVLASDFRFWKDEFGEICEYVNPLSPVEISNKVKLLLNDFERREKMTRKGLMAVQSKFNWENEATVLLDVYRNLCLINKKRKNVRNYWGC